MHALHDEWLSRKTELLSDAGGAYTLARKANRAGEHLLALEIVETVLDAPVIEDGKTPLLQQKALALARSGSTQKALETLEQVRALGVEDDETLGLSGRVYKDLAADAPDAAERNKLLAESQRLYQLGFDRFRSPYCGINAATLAVLTGNNELAQQLAAQTLDAIHGDDDYYALATRAEAALILKRDDEAAELYRRACQTAAGRWADVASTRKQCRALSLKLHGRRDKFEECFPQGVVAVFAGHLIDAPNRATPRFPASRENEVKERIKKWLTDNAVRVSFSSAACGADLIFLSVAQEMEIETNVVLPYRADAFLETSVRCGGGRWVADFENALSRAASVTVTNDEVADDKSSAYDFTNRMAAAKAALRATALDFPLKGLLVWDGQPGDGRGGTADAAACWCKAKIPIDAIHPTEPSRAPQVCEESTTPVKPFDRIETALPTGSRTTVCAVMHVYFASYFGLKEQQYRAFQEKVLGAFARTLAASSYAPLSRYGFGPDYVLVFEAIRATGIFASELLKALSEANREMGDGIMELPRLCAHAGPVQLMVNPVLNQYSHEGSTLTRAGRIVRRVSPGTIYCTEAFAALAALESIREFHFEYAGLTKYETGEEHDRLFSIHFK